MAERAGMLGPENTSRAMQADIPAARGSGGGKRMWLHQMENGIEKGLREIK